MKDHTLGIRTNRIMLNIPQAPGVEPPEPGVAAVMIDGNPIHAVSFINIQAGSDRITTCTISFECEVSGQIGGADISDMIKGKSS